MRTVRAEELTCGAFAGFGKVIEARNNGEAIAINSGTCLKFANLALPDCDAAGGQTALHIYKARPLNQPIMIKGFERHLFGSQAFIPLSDRPFLIVVAPIGTFRIEKVRVFRAKGNQGVQYDRGVWHHFCLALDAESEFLVIDRLSSEPDCEELQLPLEQQFTIAM